MKALERQLKALANKRRLAILKYLRASRGASVGEIAYAIGLSFKATSKHLGVMQTADILEREQSSLKVIYSLTRPVSGIVKTVLDLI